MKASILSVWEELANLEGWSELAASCDASPFTWPTVCLPWWYEAGWGRLRSIAVEESGLLVGLALVHDRATQFGRHEFRHFADEIGAYCQLLVADAREDVTTLLWECLLDPGWGIDLRAVPTDLAERYSAITSGAVTVSHRADSGCTQVALDSSKSTQESDLSSVRTVTDPAECIDLLNYPLDGDGWGLGDPGSRTAVFFASAVDASVRTGRMTLHVEHRFGAPWAGVVVLHGAGTSAVWRCTGGMSGGTQPPLVESVAVEAARRGSRRIVWPQGAGVPGEQFPLCDLSRSIRSGSHLERLAGFAREAVLSYRPSR